MTMTAIAPAEPTSTANLTDPDAGTPLGESAAAPATPQHVQIVIARQTSHAEIERYAGRIQDVHTRSTSRPGSVIYKDVIAGSMEQQILESLEDFCGRPIRAAKNHIKISIVDFDFGDDEPQAAEREHWLLRRMLSLKICEPRNFRSSTKSEPGISGTTYAPFSGRFEHIVRYLEDVTSGKIEPARSSIRVLVGEGATTRGFYWHDAWAPGHGGPHGYDS